MKRESCAEPHRHTETNSNNHRIAVSVLLKVDGKWAEKLSREELAEQIRSMVNDVLGVRGQVKRIEVSQRT